MRKTARPHPESDRHVLCPFCETDCERSPTDVLCSGCGARGTPDGESLVFDASDKADRQTVNEAERAGDQGRRAAGLTGAARRRPVGLGRRG